MKTRLLMAWLLGSLLWFWPVTPCASAVPPTIHLEPATQTVQPGTVFTTAVQIDDAVDLGAFEFTLVFNPATLQVEQVTLGSFLASTGRSAGALGPTINNQAGTVAFGAFSFGIPAGPNGSGSLAVITWRATNAGSSSVTFSGVQLTDSLGQSQGQVNTTNGSVTVGGTSPTATHTTTPPTHTPSPTATGSATVSPGPSHTPTASRTASPGPSHTPTASHTVSPGPSCTPTATLRWVRIYLPVILKGFRR
jgi:hypothetical protein